MTAYTVYILVRIYLIDMYFEKVEKKIKDVVTERYSLCDKCNEKIGDDSDKGNAFEFELKYKTGDSYPESGNGDEETMELCYKCADDCIKLLKDNGYRINKSEWDY